MNKEAGKIISKADIILFGIILAVALTFIVIYSFKAKQGATVQISVDGTVVKQFDIEEQGDYKVETDMGYNMIEIQNGKAVVSGADCPDKVCVRHAPITNVGETIICLPHKLVVEVVE